LDVDVGDLTERSPSGESRFVIPTPERSESVLSPVA
jgi:hypothetical protein